MFWVIQDNMKPNEEGWADFIEALREVGALYCLVNLTPFSHDMTPDPVRCGMPNPDCVVAFGSISMSEAARKRGWTPGTWLNDNFDQRVWGEKYGVHCLNADAEFCTLEQIQPFDGLRFMRPVHDLKSMTGSLVDWKWVKEQQDHFAKVSVHFREDRRTLCHDTPISLSADKDIDHEARFFVVGGKVRAGSYYRVRGQNHGERIKVATRLTWEEPSGIWEFAQFMADIWSPADAYVIDIAEIDRYPGVRRPDYYVIEINCINHSGFYAADMKPVIQAIEDM